MRSFLLALTAVGLAACHEPLAPSTPTTSSDYSVSAAASWTTLQLMPTGRSFLALTAANSRIYAIGGIDQLNRASAALEVYNPGLVGLGEKRWTRKALLPEARSRGNGARHIDGMIYVPGGWDASNRRTNTLFAYGIASNAWTRLAPLPAASGCGGTAVLGGMLYVFSGCGGLLHRYTPSTNSWATLASAPVAHAYPALGQINGKIYVAGGHDAAGQPTATLHVYDPATNLWSAKASMPGFRIYTSGYALGGKLYVVGGRAPPNGRISATMLIYDPATDVWSTGQSMRTERDALSLFGVGGKLYAVGGRSDHIAGHRTVERYTP